MSTWFLPTISEVLALTEPALGPQIENHRDTAAQAEREWSAAIAALTQLLQQVMQQSSGSRADLGGSVGSMQPQGLVLTGPSAILNHAGLNACLESWIFTAEAFNTLSFQLPPATGQDKMANPQSLGTIPLVPKDPLDAERFCLVLTADFSLVMALGKDPAGKPSFSFSFALETAQKAWEVLRSRVLLTRSLQVGHLDTLVGQFAQTEPHYQIVMQFSRFLSKFLSALTQVNQSQLPTGVNFSKVSHSHSRRLSSEQSDIATKSSLPSTQPSHIQTHDTDDEEQDLHSCRQASLDGSTNYDGSPDIKLLRAIAHEVRTPLTTINTLIRLLLKRSDLPSEVVQRLESIHRECTEQIDRFGLIFRAAELKSEFQRSPIHLTSVSLTQVLRESTPRWQKQAARRNLTLHVALPQQMPAVVSDPMMLDQVLTGLIDRFTRSLTAGSHIYIQVTLAGEQLKLQLRAQPNAVDASEPEVKDSAVPVLESIGQLLMLQPETGCLSLSLPVTKNLFQALGGKLTVRKQPQQGEILTIFLPLGPESGATS